MPNMDGVQATQQIRAADSKQLPSTIPIIALTGHEREQVLESYLAQGLNDCLSKPVSLDQLSDLLNHYL